MISVLLSFMAAVYGLTGGADPGAPPGAEVSPADPVEMTVHPSLASTAGEGPPPGLAPGYLALVLDQPLRQIPLFADSAPLYDDEGLSLSLPTTAVFPPGAAHMEATVLAELGRFANAIGPVANTVAISVVPDPPIGRSFAESPSAADWEGAIGRALALGRVLADGGLADGRLSLLAGGGRRSGETIRVIVEAEGERR